MRLILWLLGATALLSAEEFTYWIQPCSVEMSRSSACTQGDAELARWALEAWQRSARPDLAFSAVAEDHARIRLYWASGRERLYGEARPIEVDGKLGAAIYVNPDVA